MSKQTINDDGMPSVFLSYLYYNLQNGKLWNGLSDLINDIIFKADVKAIKEQLIGQKSLCNDIDKIKQYDYYIDICNKRLESFS